MYQQNSAGPTGSTFTPGKYVVMPPTANAKVPVLSHPRSTVKIIAQLSAGASIQALSQEGSLLRIQLPQGQVGYIAATSARPQNMAAASATNSVEGQVRERRYDFDDGMSAPQSRSASSPKIEYTSKPKGRAAQIAVFILLLVLSGIALAVGFLDSSFVEESCPISDIVNGTRQDCQVISHPYAATGNILLILGGLGLLIAIIIVIRLRSKRP